jgi:hypothetical protein
METTGDTEKPIWEYIQEAKQLKARIAKYQEILEIDHYFKWSEADGEMVRHEIPDDERDSFPNAITCREADTHLLEIVLEHRDPIVHAAEELMWHEMDKYKVGGIDNLTCPYMRKLYEALDADGRMDLPDSPNLTDKI